ncbi:MAG: 2-polyprenyl-3-methyl-6-methoxy-1,4-benzoquinone monooxygenase [Gammaproteobacteria bacterium]|nr:2-polyprenyl-3-methyl-6-methoxy-1,4-benzoquinone monooxygenase [Gammaproteobacteria bacterium]
MILTLDAALRTTLPGAAAAAAARPSPAGGAIAEAHLDARERALVAALMRINHAGEVCAQALYRGQAAVARAPVTRAVLERAAAEESDHLAWCAERLEELGAHTSRLGPLWYLGAYGTGMAAGLAGDRCSLGFVSETERQVEAHLNGHLGRLPAADGRSRAILEQMREDEVRHGRSAEQAGGRPPPGPVRRLMALQARVMTTLAFFI